MLIDQYRLIDVNMLILCYFLINMSVSDGKSNAMVLTPLTDATLVIGNLSFYPGLFSNLVIIYVIFWMFWIGDGYHHGDG